MIYSAAVSVSAAVLNSARGLLFLSAATLFVFALARPGPRRIRFLFFAAAAGAAAAVATQSLFYSLEPRTAVLTIIPADFFLFGRLTGGISVYKEGAFYGLVQSLRLVSVMLMASTLVISTHPAHILTEFNRMRLPRAFGFVIAMSVKFLPYSLEQARRIILALRMRGIKLRTPGGMFSIARFVFTPLVMSCLQQAGITALAAEVRGGSLTVSPQGEKLPRRFFTFSTLELVTMAFFIVLMYAASLPFKMGLNRAPFMHNLFFSLPFSCMLFACVRLIPKRGTAAFLICGYSLFVQTLFTGINPIRFISPLAEAVSLELFFFLSRRYADSYLSVIIAGILRGFVVCLFFYLVVAPYIWHRFYAPWYIWFHIIQNVAGSVTGAILGFRLGSFIKTADNRAVGLTG